MDIGLHLPHLERREADWSAAAVAGFAAGAVLMVVELVWAAFVSSGDGPWRIAQLVAALMLGPENTLHVSARLFDAGIVVAALATHYGLGAAFGLLIGRVVAGFRLDDRPVAALAVGAALGLLLYAVNFHALTAFFPWFQELRGWSTATAHVVFGASAAVLYWRLARPGVARPGSG